MMYSFRIFSSSDNSLLFICHCDISGIEFILDNIDFFKSGYYFKVEVL